MGKPENASVQNKAIAAAISAMEKEQKRLEAKIKRQQKALDETRGQLDTARGAIADLKGEPELPM